MQYRAVTGWRAQGGDNGGGGQIIPASYSVEHNIELAANASFTPGVYLSQSNLQVLNSPPSWIGKKASGNCRVYVDHIVTATSHPGNVPSRTKIDVDFYLHMPNIVMMSMDKAQPGSFKWFEPTGYGNRHPLLGTIDIDIDTTGNSYFIWLHNWIADYRSSSTLEELNFNLHVMPSGNQYFCRVYPVVLMNGDEDIQAYTTAPGGLYEGIVRPTPYDTDMGVQYGILPGVAGWKMCTLTEPGVPVNWTYMSENGVEFEVTEMASNQKYFDIHIRADLTVGTSSGDHSSLDTVPSDGSIFELSHHLGYALAFERRSGLPYP